MKPGDSKKYIFAEKEQTPDKKPNKIQQPKPKTTYQYNSNFPKSKTNDKNLPPKYNKPADVFKQANNIIEKANQAEKIEKNYKMIPSQKSVDIEKQDNFLVTDNVNRQKQKLIKQFKGKEQKLLKEFESREKQLQQKIANLEEELRANQKQQTNLQQKFNNLSKEHKNCAKQLKRANELARQKQQELIKMLDRQEISFNKKRQYFMQNQINSLNRYNRQLVSRIKAYKGSDLAQMAIEYNKVNILNEYKKQKLINSENMILKLENIGNKIAKRLDQYIKKKTKKLITFQQEQNLVIYIMKDLNLFCTLSLMSGLKISFDQEQEEIIYLEDTTNAQSRADNLNDSFELISKRTQLNLKICQQTNTIISDQNQLISRLGNYPSIIRSCFKKNKKVPEIQKDVQQLVGLHLNRYQKLNQVLVSCISALLFKYDQLEHFVETSHQNIRTEMEKINVPLQGIRELYDYGEDKMYKQKLAAFVSHNLNKLQASVVKLEKLNTKLPMDFIKLKNSI